MKKNSGIIFAISAILIIIIGYTFMFGIVLGDYQIKPVINNLTLGLDLKGGVYVEEEIVDKNVDKDMLNRVKDLLELRINGLGTTEAVVAVMPGTNRIRIEMPGVYDVNKALDAIGKTGKLRFVGPDKVDVLTGDDVKDASVGVDPQTNQPVVQLKLKEAGAKKFSEATGKFIGQIITIYMDEEIASSPKVNNQIPNGEAIITGSKDINEAKRLAGIIKSGALPVKLAPATVKTIGPSLGAEAGPTSAKAAVIGITLVMLFMLVYYKLPGLIADFALAVYIIISLIVFISLKQTLTLPGIAGFLLSIGMAVDANVLIFERLKEELRLGKSLKSSVDLGFHRALSSIIDSQLTTLIAGVVLIFFGSGTVKGFAITLSIGTVVSVFTAVTVTKFLLKSFVNAGWVKNVELYKPIIK